MDGEGEAPNPAAEGAKPPPIDADDDMTSDEEHPPVESAVTNSPYGKLKAERTTRIDFFSKKR